jgi:AraC-like DNA-binding protein
MRDANSRNIIYCIPHLLHSPLALNPTAYLLGYEDAKSFFRAFHQWEGTSPGEWRAVHAHRGNTNNAPASVA